MLAKLFEKNLIRLKKADILIYKYFYCIVLYIQLIIMFYLIWYDDSIIRFDEMNILIMALNVFSWIQLPEMIHPIYTTELDYWDGCAVSSNYYDYMANY